MKIIIRCLSIIMALLIITNCNAITLNGQDIATLAQPGQAVSYVGKDAHALCFIIKKNGDIVVSSFSVNNMQEIDELYVQLQNERHMFTKSCVGREMRSRSRHMKLHGFDGNAGEKIILQADQAIDAEAVFLQAKEIFLISDNIQARPCFVEADVLQIEFSQKNSVLAAIRFEFDKETGVAHPVIQCDVNCANKEQDNTIIVTGARRVHVQFYPAAFN